MCYLKPEGRFIVLMEWKERGVSNVRLLEYPKSEKYRILMRDLILKICCNHYLLPPDQYGNTSSPWKLKSIDVGNTEQFYRRNCTT